MKSVFFWLIFSVSACICLSPVSSSDVKIRWRHQRNYDSVERPNSRLEAQTQDLSLWRDVDVVDPLQIYVRPSLQETSADGLLTKELVNIVQDNYDDGQTLAVDIHRRLDKYTRQNLKATPGEFFRTFRTLKEMISFMMESIVRCGGRCSLFNIGNSHQGRPVIGIKITARYRNLRNKPKIWISAGIHAREWIAHSSALYLANKLIEGYHTDPYIHHLVDTYEWYIIPCVNPDGYNYTWTTDRLWRKTRSHNAGTKCVGTDANRNFGFKWGHVGSSSDPCANDYRGAAPFSEPESRNVATFILSEARTGPWLVFLSLHSEAQLVMSPWGYTGTLPEDYDELRRVGQAIAFGIAEKNGLPFRFGSAANVLYYSAGTSRDWARAVADIKYVYTVELRRSNRLKWIPSADQIVPAGEEMWAGLVEGMKAIENRSSDS